MLCFVLGKLSAFAFLMGWQRRKTVRVYLLLPVEMGDNYDDDDE